MPAASELSAPIVVEDPALLHEVGRLPIRAWKANGELPSFAPNPDIWLDEHWSARSFVLLDELV